MGLFTWKKETAVISKTDDTQKQIDSLTKRIKALENQIMPQQSIQDVKPKRKRIRNSYADSKFNKAFEIASGYYASGLKQTEIAYKLNAMNIKTPTGKSFHQGNVSHLLADRAQKKRFMQSKSEKRKTAINRF